MCCEYDKEIDDRVRQMLDLGPAIQFWRVGMIVQIERWSKRNDQYGAVYPTSIFFPKRAFEKGRNENWDYTCQARYLGHKRDRKTNDGFYVFLNEDDANHFFRIEGMDKFTYQQAKEHAMYCYFRFVVPVSCRKEHFIRAGIGKIGDYWQPQQAMFGEYEITDCDWEKYVQPGVDDAVKHSADRGGYDLLKQEKEAVA